jgi:hypothetical protein
MAAPGSRGEGQTTRIIEWLAADRRLLRSANIGGSTMGKIPDASHPRGSAGAGFARGTELLAGT